MSSNHPLIIETPKIFNWNECLIYLDRCPLETTHTIREQVMYKVFRIKENNVLIKMRCNQDNNLQVEVLDGRCDEASQEAIRDKISWMLDFSTSLGEFYKQTDNDVILGRLVDSYHGLRIIKIEDLFEGLTWAIMGQQINLKFAYTLKQRFVEQHGVSVTYEGKSYWLYPTPESISKLTVEDLKQYQFTTRKAEYIIGIANEMVNGSLKRETLAKLNYEEAKKQLLRYRGIGEWTADYVLLKCFNRNEAFPIGDAGLQNALKALLEMEKKPNRSEIERLATNWQGWEAYATFYLWRSLYE